MHDYAVYAPGLVTPGGSSLAIAVRFLPPIASLMPLWFFTLCPFLHFYIVASFIGWRFPGPLLAQGCHLFPPLGRGISAWSLLLPLDSERSWVFLMAPTGVLGLPYGRLSCVFAWVTYDGRFRLISIRVLRTQFMVLPVAFPVPYPLVPCYTSGFLALDFLSRDLCYWVVLTT